MVHCESPYKERFKQRSGLREKDPWHFKGWQEVSLAEEAARDRMVGDEGKESLGEGRMGRSQEQAWETRLRICAILEAGYSETHTGRHTGVTQDRVPLFSLSSSGEKLFSKKHLSQKYLFVSVIGLLYNFYYLRQYLLTIIRR